MPRPVTVIAPGGPVGRGREGSREDAAERLPAAPLTGRVPIAEGGVRTGPTHEDVERPVAQGRHRRSGGEVAAEIALTLGDAVVEPGVDGRVRRAAGDEVDPAIARRGDRRGTGAPHSRIRPTAPGPPVVGAALEEDDVTGAPDEDVDVAADGAGGRDADRRDVESGTVRRQRPLGPRRQLHDLVPGAVGRGVVQRSVGPLLDRPDPVVVALDDGQLLRPDQAAGRVHGDDVDAPVLQQADRHRALHATPGRAGQEGQPAGGQGRGATRPDGAYGGRELRQVRHRVVALGVRVGRQRIPAVVAAAGDPVDLVVAGGSVLGGPQLGGPGPQRETLDVAVPVGPDVAGVSALVVERVVGGRATGGVDPQHLAAETLPVLRIGSLCGVAGADVQLAVGAEPQPAAGVSAAGQRKAGDQGAASGIGIGTRARTVGVQHPTPDPHVHPRAPAAVRAAGVEDPVARRPGVCHQTEQSALVAGGGLTAQIQHPPGCGGSALGPDLALAQGVEQPTTDPGEIPRDLESADHRGLREAGDRRGRGRGHDGEPETHGGRSQCGGRGNESVARCAAIDLRACHLL